jgi:iron complex transport system permease protein
MAVNSIKLITLFLLWLLFCSLGLLNGTIDIPFEAIVSMILGDESIKESWKLIFFESRLPKIITASLAGASLSVSALFMQTFFRNPLAGPYVLGVSSGASLGVAIFILGQSVFMLEFSDYQNQIGLVLFASIGSLISMMIVLIAAKWIKGFVTLLIIGLMLNYFTSALVSILQKWSQKEENEAFIFWNFGSFEGVNWELMKIYFPIVAVFLLLSFIFIRPLDVFLLGERIAKSMGMEMSKIRLGIIFVASVLAGVTTAFCGPIAFVGLAVPHIARWTFKSSRHAILVPGCLLIGMVITTLADFICHLPPPPHDLPINSVTSLIGTPVVLILIIMMSRSKRNMQ